MIQVEGLTKRYGDVTAIENLNFHVARGEIVGFLGPNGAGKTTTMRVLTGYLPPTEGSAHIAGYDIFSESLQARRRIGYMPETVPLYPEMTVRGYLHFMAEIRGVRDRRTAVAEAMALCHVEDRAGDIIATLSKGYRQRVGLAQALLHKPDVLILDEPTLGLDPRQIIEVRELIRELGQERTVLLSSHILPEVSQVCTRVLIIHKGHIVAEDTPEGLTARLQGATRLVVQVARPSPKVEAALSTVPGVEGVEPAGDGRYEIASAPDADVRTAVAETVVQGGWGLLELRPVGMSLEEIFLQLTREESPIEEIAEQEVEADA
ncbi:MAG TPA: ATP-binding cassette domain-containing protein [Anaerolineales bacterium]|nr:ATP-binding cassette domain-containing protein [Anaerolineae bacterium]HIQ00600.1 ATP-binding cassette domain-containing protein [Anaerolineales bacterium]